jgi:hypothetical protein
MWHDLLYNQQAFIYVPPAIRHLGNPDSSSDV